MVLLNLFDLPETAQADELVDDLINDKANNLRIERIISTGQTTEWLTQQQNEFVALLAGKSEITYLAGRTLTLVPGDTLLIPAGVTHRVSYTSSEPPSIWLTVFYG